jgi:hypothetical protein
MGLGYDDRRGNLLVEGLRSWRGIGGVSAGFARPNTPNFPLAAPTQDHASQSAWKLSGAGRPCVWIDWYEVTNVWYADCVGAGPVFAYAY